MVPSLTARPGRSRALLSLCLRLAQYKNPAGRSTPSGTGCWMKCAIMTQGCRLDLYRRMAKAPPAGQDYL